MRRKRSMGGGGGHIVFTSSSLRAELIILSSWYRLMGTSKIKNTVVNSYCPYNKKLSNCLLDERVSSMDSNFLKKKKK
jgi:hypothetical protein